HLAHLQQPALPPVPLSGFEANIAHTPLGRGDQANPVEQPDSEDALPSSSRSKGDLLRQFTASPKRRKRPPLIEIMIVLGIAAILILFGVKPGWWKELWTQGGQPDQTPGSVSVNWMDPDVVVEVVKYDGGTISSRSSPLTAPLNPGLHRLRVMKG